MEFKFNQNNDIILIDDDEVINIVNYNDKNSYSVLLEKDGLILHSCESFNALFETDVTNKKLSDILCNDTYEELRKMMIESLFTNNQVVNVIKIYSKIYKTSISPIFDSKMNIRCILLNICDITKDKKIEEEFEYLKIKLEESNSIKSTFLSNVSHELRTPMNTIIGFSDILLQNKKNNKTQLKKFLRSINSNAKHLDELLNNILDYSRMESKDLDVLYENFSINELFDELFDIFEDVNNEKNSNFVKFEFIKSDDKKIIFDYLRLKQVLFNLISNSIKFTNNGHIKISFDATDKFITFKVEDTGIGISEEKLKFVFDRFWQCDSSSTKKYKGVGLGLAISKSIIELFNGDIKIESELNKGTTCYVKIPLEMIKNDLPIKNKNKIDFSGKTVLIIDELPIKYSLLGIFLNSLHVNMLSAYSGKEAIEILNQQKEKIDLIFLDMNLPDIKASELSKKIKELCGIQIVSKSGKDAKNIETIDYHLKKPINKDKLLFILNKIW